MVIVMHSALKAHCCLLRHQTVCCKIVVQIVAVWCILSLEGIQGHKMFIDESGDSEANYTVLALTTDYNAPIGDVNRRRVLSPIGHFRAGNHNTGPVSIQLRHRPKK